MHFLLQPACLCQADEWGFYRKAMKYFVWLPNKPLYICELKSCTSVKTRISIYFRIHLTYDWSDWRCHFLISWRSQKFIFILINIRSTHNMTRYKSKSVCQFFYFSPVDFSMSTYIQHRIFGKNLLTQRASCAQCCPASCHTQKFLTLHLLEIIYIYITIQFDEHIDE